MRRLTGLGIALISLVALSLTGACRTSPYYLPSPTTAEAAAEAARKSADAAGAPASDEALNLAARTSLLKLYELLSQQRYEEAESHLSQETREFLGHASPRGDASDALASGELKLGDAPPTPFDPVKLLIGGNIASVRDAIKGVNENETPNRRELFVIDPQGQPHRVIMILEGGKWVLQKTSIRPDNAITAGD